MRPATHLNAQDELINRLINECNPECGQVYKVDNGGKLVEKLSKSRKIVQKSEKYQRSKEFAKIIGSKEYLPKYQSSVY